MNCGTISAVTPASTDEDRSLSALVNHFAEIGRALGAAGSVVDTLVLSLTLAESVIESCDYAGIFVLDAGSVTTPQRTDPIVIEFDRLQQTCGEGPCLDSLALGEVVYAEDLADDRRWPHYGAAVTRNGIRTVLALPLVTQGPPTALTLYAKLPRAFGAIDRAQGHLLAAFSGVALNAARVHQDDERIAANLHDALASREIIGQAQGILIERERITPEQAFDVLRRASQHLNVKLRDVAQNLVDTGEEPETRSTAIRLTPTAKP